MVTAGTSGPAASPRLSRAIYVLVLLCLINAFSYLDRNMIGLVLPQMTAELELSDTISGLVTGLPFALCYAALAIPAAWVADNHNRRNLLAAALSVWSMVTLATGAVQSGWHLALARFGLGAGEAAGHPTTSSLVADLFPIEQRTAAFAAISASAYLGPLVGFPLVGWILAEHGWRSAYVAMGAGGLVLALLFALTVSEPKRGLSTAQEPSRLGFAEGLKRLWTIPSYRFVVLAGGFNAINQGAQLTWGASFLDRIHGLGPQEMGFYFGTMRGAAGLAGALLAATAITALVKRDLAWQIRAPIVIAVLPFIGDALFLFGRTSLLWQAGLAFSALATAMAIAISYTLYVNIVPPNLRAQAAAFYFLVASLMGFILGPFSVGALSDLFAADLGREAITWGMLIASAATLVSALLLFMARRRWLDDARRAEAN